MIWRQRPDSNWGWRFCRPLPYHLATSPRRKNFASFRFRLWRKRHIHKVFPPAPPKANLLLRDPFSQWKKDFNWSGQRGSNSLPPPWQGGALPDELCPHTNVVPPTRLCSTILTLRWPSLPSSRKLKQMSRACSQLLASSLHSMQEPPKGFSRDGNYPGRIFLVPPTGIEPVTRGFSVLCSTD